MTDNIILTGNSMVGPNDDGAYDGITSDVLAPVPDGWHICFFCFKDYVREGAICPECGTRSENNG